MIYWITGRPGSGKTTLAKRIAKQTNGVILDGDEIRKIFPTGFSEKERIAHQRNIAKLAHLFEEQGHIVIISCVSPYRKWREAFQELFEDCVEIALPFGELWKGTTYEEPV